MTTKQEERRVEHTEMTTIALPYSAEGPLHLILRVGACRLKLRRGEAQQEWISGTYRDPSGTIPCKISTDRGETRISQDTSRWSDMFGRFRDFPATFDLAIPRSSMGTCSAVSARSILKVTAAGVHSMQTFPPSAVTDPDWPVLIPPSMAMVWE
jgi:hypothetical protein